MKSPWFFSKLFYQIHFRLNGIFGCITKLPFAGLPVLVCGQLYHLPPVQGTPIYCNTGNMKEFFCLELWRGFKITELTEIMRQQGDYEFISPFNKIQVEAVDDNVEKLLISTFVAKDDLLYPKYVVHMFAKNCPV